MNASVGQNVILDIGVSTSKQKTPTIPTKPKQPSRLIHTNIFLINTN